VSGSIRSWTVPITLEHLVVPRFTLAERFPDLTALRDVLLHGNEAI